MDELQVSKFSLLRNFVIAHKITVALGVVLVVALLGGLIAFQRIISSKDSGSVDEVDLPFDPEGPFALLHPRRDGNALVLNLTRTASYDSISYELAYTSKPDSITNATPSAAQTDEGGDSSQPGSIDRGVVGNINTKDRKGEYEQEVLFGTCSKNVCKYDQGVENGTLTLHIKKGKQAYRMVTQWHLQKPDVALGKLSSGDGHFMDKLDADRAGLTVLGYTIINDLSGAPKLPEGKGILGKVYSLNAPVAKEVTSGQVSIELADNAPADAKIARYDSSQNKWVELDTKTSGSTLTAKAEKGGIFTVLTSKK